MTDLQTTDPTTTFKLQAKRLRAAMAARGTVLTHSAALELVAIQHGARDWNTLAASAAPAPQSLKEEGPGLTVGAAVRGRYLGQSFTGRVLSLTVLPTGGLNRVTIHFDVAVDVVTFDSFSAYRQRITAVIGRDGISPRRTSDGVPHLVIEG